MDCQIDTPDVGSGGVVDRGERPVRGQGMTVSKENRQTGTYVKSYSRKQHYSSRVLETVDKGREVVVDFVSHS